MNRAYLPSTSSTLSFCLVRLMICDCEIFCVIPLKCMFQLISTPHVMYLCNYLVMKYNCRYLRFVICGCRKLYIFVPPYIICLIGSLYCFKQVHYVLIILKHPHYQYCTAKNIYIVIKRYFETKHYVLYIFFT